MSQQDDDDRVVNFPQALNKQRTGAAGAVTVSVNRMSPPCTRKSVVGCDEQNFRMLAYDAVATKSKKRQAATMGTDPEAEGGGSGGGKVKRMKGGGEILEMGLRLIRAIALETDIDNSTDVTKSVMKIMQAFSAGDFDAKKKTTQAGGGREGGDAVECDAINPKALANAIYYMVDVIFGKCDDESVIRLVMVFIDAVRSHMPADETNADLDTLASSLFVYIATNRRSMRPTVML
jgi:hypothetical protein